MLRINNLFKWYAPTDVIEEYIAEKPTGLFVNCSNTIWFGLKCEYTLNSDEQLHSIVYDQFDAKRSIPIDLSVYTNGTCYEMIHTDCESIICLDWREICDGKIDCKNGYDERNCQQLEMNECNAITKRRCYDGQCIDDLSDVHLADSTCSENYFWHKRDLSDCHLSGRTLCENQKCPRSVIICHLHLFR